MVAQPRRVEDENENENPNQNQGAGNRTENINQKTKGIIIDFLSKKEEREKLLSDRSLLNAGVIESILSEENIDYKKSLLEFYFGDVIDSSKLKGEKVNEKLILELLNMNGLPKEIKNVINRYIVGNIIEPLMKLQKEKEAELENINKEIIEKRIKKEKEYREKRTEYRKKNTEIINLKRMKSEDKEDIWEKYATLKKEEELSTLKKEKEKLKEEVSTLKKEEEDGEKLYETNLVNLRKIASNIDKKGLNYSGSKSIEEAFLGIIPEGFENNDIKNIADGLKNIEFSFEDFVNAFEGNNDNYENFKEGVDIKYLLDDKYVGINDVLTTLAYAKLEDSENIVSQSISTLGGKELLTNDKVSMEYYFHNELLLFIGKYGPESTKGDKFLQNFQTFLKEHDNLKASIFEKIFGSDDRVSLDNEEQSHIIENMKYMLKEFIESKFEDGDFNNDLLNDLVENLTIPTTEWKIIKNGIEETVNISINIEIGKGVGGDEYGIFEDSTFKVNMEIDSENRVNYPNENFNRIEIILDDHEIMVDEEALKEFNLYSGQEVLLVLKDEDVDEEKYRIMGCDNGILEVQHLKSSGDSFEIIELSNITAIYTVNMKKGLSSIQKDITKYLKNQENNEGEDYLSRSERFDILENVWENDIPGEGGFKEGAVLHFALGHNDSLKPEDFGHVYSRCTVENINEAHGEFTLNFAITDSSEEDTKIVFDIEKCCLSQENNLFSKLKTSFGGEFFTMQDGIDSKKEFKEYLIKNSKIDGAKELNIPGEMREYAKNDNFDDISYIGRVGLKTIKVKENGEPVDKEVDSPLFFKPTFEKNRVRLESTGGYNLYMTYDEFLIFMADKDLKPYTTEEKTDAEKDIESKSSTKMNFYSLENVLHLFKMPTEQLKTKWKRRDDMLGSELYGNIIGSKSAQKAFGWIPYMNEVSQEANSHADSKIKTMISEYEDHFEKNFSHDTIASISILDELLADEATALRTHKKHRYKAVGAYKFAAKKDHPYFRALKKQAGSGLWVLAILGPEYYARYKKQFANLKKRAKNNPGDTEFLNELTLSEMDFIKSNIDKTKLYPGGSGPGMEGARDESFNKVQEGRDNMKKKFNFATRNSSKESTLGNHRLSRWVGEQEQTLATVYNDMNYRIAYKDCLFMSLSGFINVGLVKNNKSVYEGMVKAIGFAPGYYVMEDGYNGGEKLADLLDLVTRKLMGGVSFKDEIKYDFEKLNSGNYHDENIDMGKRLEKFWEKSGPTLMEIMNLKNTGKDKDFFSLLNDDGDLSAYEKNLVEDYLYTKSIDQSEKYGESFANSDLSNENTYWRENVMNYPKWVSTSLFSTNQNGKFNDANNKNLSATLWDNINDKFTDLTNTVSKMSSDQKEPIRKWGVDKVIQFLEGSEGVSEEFRNIIKARSYPKGKMREDAEKAVIGKKLNLGPKGGEDKIVTSEYIENTDILKIAEKTIYQSGYPRPDKLRKGVEILIRFLDALR